MLRIKFFKGAAVAALAATRKIGAGPGNSGFGEKYKIKRRGGCAAFAAAVRTVDTNK